MSRRKRVAAVPAKVDASACCVADEAAKAAQESGCGCSSKAATRKETADA